MPLVISANNDGIWPRIDQGAELGANGALVNVAFGLYQQTPGTVPLVGQRLGGHMVTLKQAVATTGTVLGPRQIQYRDPNSDEEPENLVSNSEYSSTVVTAGENILILREFPPLPPLVFAVTALNDPVAGEPYHIVDAVVGLYPPGMETWNDVEVNAQFATGGLGFASNQRPEPFDVPLSAEPVTVAPHPQLHSALVLLAEEDETSLVQAPHNGREPEVLMSLPADVRHLVLGYGHTVYAVTGTHVLVLNVNSDTASFVGAARLPAEALKAPVEAAAWNGSREELLLLSGSGERFFVLNRDLELTGSFRVRGAPSGAAKPWLMPVEDTFTISGASTRIIALFEGRVVAEARYGGPYEEVKFKPLDLAGVEEAVCAGIDDGQRLYVGDRTRGVLEFEFDGRRGRWQPVERPLYADFDLAGKRFSIFRSRTNITREHDLPAWNNIDPDKLDPHGPDVPDPRD